MWLTSPASGESATKRIASITLPAPSPWAATAAAVRGLTRASRSASRTGKRCEGGHASSRGSNRSLSSQNREVELSPAANAAARRSASSSSVGLCA
eukprot:5177744-Prymnesium_polylepis.2